ncbi:hypothetical protein [Prevotella melaninogenica]|jgi:hypothetical protein|uniref:hypothetical protein n=1 Tax=Prevotella melaninogenica TaxID=28132 RepID=UPI0001AEAE81|nr:hypothetical protein [Prevotella melaninogenica]ADK95478.1 hypothetical protein HMPREF0659_A6218 [Prevotella melaninogenica ATCC 25845]ASE17733.1 hypothetical protein CEP85_06425 [Prevotella melaninogenica]UEB07970.1 hypothetical protein LK441_00585 [Prevotella melaninogenica]
MNSLEEEVRQLLHEGKNVEAVLLVHKSKGCTLAEAKKYIDKLKDDDCNWKNPHNNRGWNIEYKDGRVEHITYKDDTGTHTATPGSPEWTAILMEATQTGNRKSSHTESGNKKNLLQRIFNNKVSGVFICLELVCILLLAILYIYPSYFGLHTREGYWGLFLHIILLLSLVWIICIFYRDMRKKEQRWYYRLFSFVIATGTTFVVVILVHDLTLDLIEHDVRSYEGTFSLRVYTHYKRSNDYTITWEGDTLSSDRQHNISYAHFKELEQYRTVRVTYWRHTGLVWSIEPLEKK